ncbi:outer membrane protein assembly factor BamB family protein [Actinomadura violacea]|uniref:PQQ-binding-like beta-propeller repeat protein n=1 Tax=Actinomadura violacea TaxID=2819934 RepID=A0ABS3S1S3_9ACTN|nr:PQQ-binding-like beta-propeller repeat protein [Actinomadura violacea]MBO2462958.1 PQQ-binding-like beta-propeller repeat protein [Actinomadura violacea]
MRLRRPAVIASIGMAVLAAGCTDSEEPKRPGIELDRTTASGGAAPEADRGLPAGPLREQWRADVPDLPNPAGTRVEIVAGQVVVFSDRGLDVLDAGTGQPRWHYRERSRSLTDYTVTRDTIVLTTAASGTVAGLEPGTERRRARSTALDAATGRTLWTDDRTLWVSDDTMSLEQQVALRRVFPSAKTGTVVLTSTDEKKPGLVGVNARNGERRWSWAPSDAAGAACTFKPQDTDGSLLVVEADCSGMYALDPASGAVRWKRATGASKVVTRDGATIVTTYGAGGGNLSVLVGADGRELWKLSAGPLAAEEIAVAGDRAVVGVADHDSGHGLRMEFVNLRTGKAEGRADARTHDGLATGGGRVYGVRQWLGEYETWGAAYDPRLVPGALDVIDPVRGAVTTVPLPFALDSRALEALPRPVVIEGDRVLRVRPSDTGLRLTAYGPGEAAAPVETGGVPARDWPDACSLTAKAPGVRSREDLAGRPLRLGRTSIPHWGCRVEGPDALRFRIGWVARTTEDAHTLLDGVGGSAVRGIGDEARLVKGELGYELLMRAGRFLVAFESADTSGFDRSVENAVAKALA